MDALLYHSNWDSKCFKNEIFTIVWLWNFIRNRKFAFVFYYLKAAINKSFFEILSRHKFEALCRSRGLLCQNFLMRIHQLHINSVFLSILWSKLFLIKAKKIFYFKILKLKEGAHFASQSTVVSSIQDNKVPYSFLILFLIQFILMVIDRALYLRKNRRGKFIFQLFYVLTIHILVRKCLIRSTYFDLLD